MSDDFGKRVVDTEDPDELLNHLGLSKQPKDTKVKPLEFEPAKGVDPTGYDVGELIQKRKAGVGMDKLTDGGASIHAPPPEVPALDLEALAKGKKEKTSKAEVGAEVEEAEAEEVEAEVPIVEKPATLGEVLGDDAAVDEALAVGSVKELKEALTKQYTEEFIVRAPGSQPLKVIIGPVNTARMATMHDYAKSWRDSKGDKIAEEARQLALYIINGTIQPAMTVDDKEWLLDLPWQTSNDWASAIQRVSNILQQIDWDERAEAISEDVCQTIELGLREAFVNPFEDGLPKGVNENNLAAYMENIIESLLIGVKPLLNITIQRAQALGQDRFCHGDRGAPRTDELKND